jgi:hypothetical protein
LRQQGAQVLRGFDWSWRRYANEFVGIVENTAVSRAA